jgi:hypothetical protein
MVRITTRPHGIVPTTFEATGPPSRHGRRRPMPSGGQDRENHEPSRFFLKAWLLLLLLGPSRAVAEQVVITSITGMLQPGAWVETIVVENRGTTNVTQWALTSQPYNGDKWSNGQDPVTKLPKPGPNVTARMVSGLDIPAGKSVTVTFRYTGSEGHAWQNLYVDLYNSINNLIINNREYGTIHKYAFLDVTPGPVQFADSFLFPYPNALAAAGLGPTTFSVQDAVPSLPAGWSLSSLGPSVFTLAAGQSELINAVFTPPATPHLGDTASVNFDIIPQGVVGPDTLHRSSLGVTVVPEPYTLTLIGTGAVGLLGYTAWRRARRRA